MPWYLILFKDEYDFNNACLKFFPKEVTAKTLPPFVKTFWESLIVPQWNKILSLVNPGFVFISKK